MHIKMLDTFLTGHPGIDGDHKDIMNAINGVADAVEAGEYDRCAVLLDDFLTLCINHFKSEEELLASLDYPWLKEHALFHSELVLKAKGVKALCMDRQRPDSIKRCFEEMATLLVEDVVKGDLQFVSFLVDKGLARPY